MFNAIDTTRGTGVSTLSILQNWHTRQPDFVLAYPQADVKTEQYIDMLVGFDFGGKSKLSRALILIKNIYGVKAS